MPKQIKIKIGRNEVELELPFVEAEVLESLLQTIIALRTELQEGGK